MTQKSRLRFFISYFLLFPIFPTAFRWLKNRGSSISKQKSTVFVLIGTTFYFLLFSGCAGKRIRIDPGDPLFEYKSEFYSQYEIWVLDEELEILKALSSVEEVDKFKEYFWKIRDTDPSTPENEYKEEIDQRFLNIENEIFATDPDIPGTRFDRNGGAKGDLAHVYLLHGAPLKGHKFKLSEGNYHVELVAWYYLDYQGRHLMRFLFYENGGKLQLFRDQFYFSGWENLLNPSFSPLKKLSNRPGISTVEEMWELWQELERDDPEGIFRTPMFSFSDYTHIDKDTRWTIEKALEAPEPAALTAKRFKPVILGQPDDLSERKFLYNSYNSFIPAKLVIIKDGRPSFSLAIGYSSIDWEVKEESAETVLDIRISFQHKESRNIREFSARLRIPPKPRDEVEKKIKGVLINGVLVPVVMNINLDNVQNFAQTEKTRQTLRQLIDDLEPGNYVVNVDLRHAVTKKSNAWREEITISH